MPMPELKKVGLKLTIPRIKILQLLQQSKQHHVSAEDIYTQLKEERDDVGLATVYRVLTQFEAAGLVIKHRFEGDHAVYELAHEKHHDHLVCLNCKRVEEFVDETIEQRQQQIAQTFGFKMTDHCLHIYGICKDCQNNSN